MRFKPIEPRLSRNRGKLFDEFMEKGTEVINEAIGPYHERMRNIINQSLGCLTNGFLSLATGISSWFFVPVASFYLSGI